MKTNRRKIAFLLPAVIIISCWVSAVHAAPQTANISGEIQSLTIDPPRFTGDVWMGGRIVVGGQSVIIPRNLLLDLPANRLSLKQLFDQSPNPACVTAGQSGLAKADTCLGGGPHPAGFATIAANILDSNNVIAGDVYIEKGKEIVAGRVTYVNHSGGWFRVNGRPNHSTTGTMIRLNDPTRRHTIQKGTGCVAGNTVNCSPDPRFTLDPDNYTAAFVSGVPACIPSTVTRTFSDVLDLNNNSNTTEKLTAKGLSDGTGDILCPETNRTVNAGKPMQDSRRYAPIRLGDNITAEGNYEEMNGIRFLSAHTLRVSDALTTRNVSTQPDYMFIEEAFMDMAGFQNQRLRTLFIGFTTLPSDVLIWSLHRDPKNNEPHEFPLGSVRGCEAADPGTCAGQGLAGGADIFRIRHDVDFVKGADPKLNPCAHINGDPRFPSVCPGGGTIGEMFGILSPIPREIQARTGHKLKYPDLITLDIRGRKATNGQYLFPFGIGLGGIDVPNFAEINLNKMAMPTLFEGLPWLLDRRLSPGGCNGPCEASAQPAYPFPISGIDPRKAESTLPVGSYNDPVYTARTLTNVRNRILSYTTETPPGSGTYKPDGNNTVLSLPAAPPARGIPVVKPVPLVCTP